MTNREAKKMVRPFIQKSKTDNDACMVVHFSRIEDKYKGITEGMDMGDALTVIYDLLRVFKIKKELL